MAEQQTWTFVGHWEDDRIVVEYVLPGEQQDQREDMGYWEQGLWAAAGTGATMEEAQANAVAEYEAEYEEPEEPVRQWIVNGTSMVVEATNAEAAIERAEQMSGWHWEATEVLKDGVRIDMSKEEPFPCGGCGINLYVMPVDGVITCPICNHKESI